MSTILTSQILKLLINIFLYQVWRLMPTWNPCILSIFKCDNLGQMIKKKSIYTKSSQNAHLLCESFCDSSLPQIQKKQRNTVECLKVEYDVFCYYEIDGLYYGIKGLYIWFFVHWHINLLFISEGFCPWAIVSSISFQEEEKNIRLKMHFKKIYLLNQNLTVVQIICVLLFSV